jgi:hypothetical protein
MDTTQITDGAADGTRHQHAKRKVRAWMISTGRNYDSLAAELGISAGHLQTVVYGLKGCSTGLALRWSRLSKLPVSTIIALRKADPAGRRSGWRQRPTTPS